MCRSIKLCKDEKCKRCFLRSFASSLYSKYWHINNKIAPRYVSIFSSKKFLFLCECGHVFYKHLNNLKKRNRFFCAFCSKTRICGNKNCKDCWERSFAANPFSKYWHEDNHLKPYEVSSFSNRKYKFHCSKCNHDFITKVRDSEKTNNICPYCASKTLCDDPFCDFCDDKSFASNDKSEYWDYTKNEICPREVFASARQYFYFNCPCGHNFKTLLNNITSGGTWCPYCSSKKMCDDLDCEACLLHSFASDSRSCYWSEKNNILPRNVFLSSSKKYNFICENGHEFSCRISNITQNNRWCPLCLYKTQMKLLKWLKSVFPTKNIMAEVTFDWCRFSGKNRFRYDFVIDEFNLIIELDGEQHFKQVSNWESPDIIQKRDEKKMQLALQNNYSCIRIDQRDVYLDKNNWMENLKNSIMRYDSPKIICIGQVYYT